MRFVKITWVERGTNNAACLGIDEEIAIRNNDTIDLDQMREAAECYASNDGVDLERYECKLEILED